MNTTQSNLKTALSDALLQEAAGKKFYESKTFWTNLLAAVAIGAQMKYGFIIDAETQALIITALNLGLRKLTSTPVIW